MDYLSYSINTALLCACIYLVIILKNLSPKITAIPDNISLTGILEWPDGKRLIEAIENIRNGLSDGDYGEIQRRMNDLQLTVEKRHKQLVAEVHGLGTHERKPKPDPTKDPVDIQTHLVPMANQIEIPGTASQDDPDFDPMTVYTEDEYDWS